MKTRLSANRRPADSKHNDTGNPFLPPPRRSNDCWAVVISVTLIASILILGAIGLDRVLPGGLVPCIVPTLKAMIRWPALFAMPAIIAVLIFSGRRNRP